MRVEEPVGDYVVADGYCAASVAIVELIFGDEDSVERESVASPTYDK
jgi:hypothetical protein